MKTLVQKKRIIIKSSGPIRLKGNIQGPIEIPYYEDVNVICKMIMEGLKVFEVLNDKTEVRLNLINYDTELNPQDPSMKKTLEPVNTKQTVTKTNHKQHSPKIVISSKKADIYEEI